MRPSGGAGSDQQSAAGHRAGRPAREGGALYLPILVTYREEIEPAVAQLAPAGGRPTGARVAGAGAQSGDYSVYTGRAELTLARVLAAGGQISEARSAATRAVQQLAKAEGADHPETHAAEQLSHASAT